MCNADNRQTHNVLYKIDGKGLIIQSVTLINQTSFKKPILKIIFSVANFAFYVEYLDDVCDLILGNFWFSFFMFLNFEFRIFMLRIILF